MLPFFNTTLLCKQIKVKIKIMPKYITTLIFPQYGIQILFLTKYKNKKRIVASIVSRNVNF